MINISKLTRIFIISIFGFSAIYADLAIETNWKEIETAWEHYHCYPSSENARRVFCALPNRILVQQKSLGEIKISEKIYNDLVILQYQVYAGDRNAVEVTYRLLNISDGAFTEDLLDLISSIIRINPKLFLEELKLFKDSEIIKELGMPVIPGVAYFRTNQAMELERKLRIAALESVKDDSLKDIRDSCIRFLKSLKF